MWTDLKRPIQKVGLVHFFVLLTFGTIALASEAESTCLEVREKKRRGI